MKNLDLFQKGVIKFGMILLLGGLCMMGTISRSVAGEVDSTRVTKWKIFGRVIDEQGEPIIGAAILEQGTTNGCVTDTLGNYKLTVKAGAVLRVSFVGYVTREIVLKKEGCEMSGCGWIMKSWRRWLSWDMVPWPGRILRGP